MKRSFPAAMGGGRSGYEYSYRFWSDEEIIDYYRVSLNVNKRAGLKSFLFEIRTDFKLKAIDGGVEKKIGHERFGEVVWENDDDGSWLQLVTSFRLKDDYWMSEEEIRSLCGDAFEFAKRRADEHAAVVPVVVGLDVWTVQREGEHIDASMDRAIRPQALIPLYLWPVVPEGSVGKWRDVPILHRKTFLRELPRIRVEELSAMEACACAVCSRNFIVGAQISSLPCGHAFHSRCVFDWLYQSHRHCPVCKSPIPRGVADFDIEEFEAQFY